MVSWIDRKNKAKLGVVVNQAEVFEDELNLWLFCEMAWDRAQKPKGKRG